MRKGADCLSKWVGEAERQLRLLFEEAKNSQPSIIFFDEIDGLAPVRSSKQDQIHASIVSTLLALMDGMDGRGQVIVIGATNRPDAVDPALRRPGRFDREFYFGLPSLDAREKILGIMTKKWENWNPTEEGEKGEQVREKLKGLAKMTKGYGGADLRVSVFVCFNEWDGRLKRLAILGPVHRGCVECDSAKVSPGVQVDGSSSVEARNY
jgi:SpoVK/Ycf46/Vps4 family AAA+-type ATPase